MSQMPTTHKKEWIQILERRMAPDELPGVIVYKQKSKLAEQPNLGTRIWSSATYDLSNAFEVAFAERDHPYVQVFQTYALRLFDRIRSESARWSDDGDWGALPMGGFYWFETAAPHEIAKAWSLDADLDAKAVLAACDKFLEAAKQIKGTGLWNDMVQCKYLTAVLFSLTFGGLEAAKPMLALRKSFGPTQQFRLWVERLFKLWPASGEAASSECVAHFDELYEKVRDPNWRKDLPSIREEYAAGSVYPSDKTLFLLQLGLLRRCGLENRKLAGDWASLIDQLSA